MMFEDEKKILKLIDFGVYDENKLIEIVKSSTCTVPILFKMIEASPSYSLLLAILDSPLLNQDLYNAVFETSKYFNSYTLFIKLLDSKFVTKAVFEFILDNNNGYSVCKKLVNSKFATEETCIRVLKKYEAVNDNVISVVDTIMNSSNMSSTVLSEIIKKAIECKDDGLMVKCLTSSFLTPLQFEKIIAVVDIDVYIYNESIPLLFKHQYMNSTRLYEIVDNHNFFASRFLTSILASPSCDKNVLLKVIDNYNLTCRGLVHIMKSSNIDLEIIMKLLDKFEAKVSFNSENVDSYLLEVLNNPLCDDKVIQRILKISTTPEIIEAIKKMPNVSKEVKIIIMTSKARLTEEDIDEILALDDLTDENYIYLVDNISSSLILDKLLEKDSLSTAVYMKMVPRVVSLSERSFSFGGGYQGDYLDRMLEKDISEVVLCELAKTVHEYENIQKISAHKNAGMALSSTLKIVADNFSDTYRQQIYQIAADIRSKILSDTFVIEEEEDVTEMLRVNVEDGLSTMLWGKSGVGKSSRVFQIDPTATLLVLKNGMFPETVIGGKEPNGEPGKIYPPHWYEVLCRKCEAEPDRKHILFIDEFTNVSDTIKNLVWEVIGYRLVNGNEEWPLPDNCSIVLAGNRPEESSAVRIDSNGGVMPAPLHNRIDSMIEVEFDIDEWQKWALETDPKAGRLRIHPIIYSFCVAHSDEVEFSEYDPQNPEEPFLSPRKWEALSTAIYMAEKRGPMHHVSYKRIYSLIGKNNVAEAFISHYERLPLDMDRVENGGYTADDFISIEDKLYALGMIIAKYEGDEMAVESFILECLGDEYYSIYMSMKNLNDAVLEQIRGKK